MIQSTIRVFPRRTKWTPMDPLAFVGSPTLWCFAGGGGKAHPPGSPAEATRHLPKETPVMVSVSFTWDIPEGERLARAWRAYFEDVRIGGPAFNDPCGEFTPGMFVKKGMVVTSRGCPKSCPFCLVPKREGRIRELQIMDGWNVSDNNLLACSRQHIEAVFEMLQRQPEPAHFTGGLDKTLLQPWHIDLLQSIRFKKAWFALDSESGLPALERAADLLSDFSREKKYCYVLVGYQQESPLEAETRLMRVFNLGFMPFSMLYRGPETVSRMHRDPEWRKLIRKWCNPARYKAFMKGTPGVASGLSFTLSENF